MCFQIRDHWKTSAIIKEVLHIMVIHQQYFSWKHYARCTIAMHVRIPCSEPLLIFVYSTGNHWFGKQKSKLFYSLCFQPRPPLIIVHDKAQHFQIPEEGIYCSNCAETTDGIGIYHQLNQTALPLLN